MRGLDFARVLVIDDNPKEAAGIIDALRSVGIPVLFFTGDLDELPDHKLEGVRLAVLDLDITGSLGTPRDIVQPTANLLAKLIDSSNGPYLALAWTKHPDLVAAIGAALKNLGIPPVELVTIEKADSKTTTGAWDTKKIAAELESHRRGNHPFQLLVEWEEAAYRSAVATVATIAGIGTSPGSIVGALGWATRAAGGTPADLIRGVGDFLARLHVDQLEAQLATAATDDALITRVRDGSAVEPSGALRAGLNGRLLFAPGRPGCGPGTIYEVGQLKGTIPGESAWWPDADAIIKDIDASGAWAAKFADKKLTPKGIAVEVTPACDEFRHRTAARFVAGVALDVEKLSGTQRDELTRFLRNEAFMLMPPLATSWLFDDREAWVIWAARLYFTLPLEPAAALQPVARLRHDALADVQDWLAGHANRPGFLSV